MSRSFGRAVIIGLGGTGQKTLIRIKKMFVENCGALPPCVKLLAFDTCVSQERESASTGEDIVFTPNEFCHLSVESIADAIRNPYIARWWIPYEAIDRRAVNHGAGGIREVGRLATFVNIDSVVSMIKKAFESIWAIEMRGEMDKRGMRLLDVTPQIYVVTSLAGGTGSGSCIDFSLLCRSLGTRNMLYTAFFVMPWVFRDVAKTANENSYAALLELEHLNRCSPTAPYSVQYARDISYSLEEEPYDIINLVDGQCRSQALVLSKEEVFEYVSECIYHSVGAIADNYRAVADNIMTMKTLAQPSEWKGQRSIYSTFGVSSIVYPGEKIHEFLSVDFAIGLIDRALTEIGGKQTATIQSAVLDPFLTSKQLDPNPARSGGLLDRILPNAKDVKYVFDDKTSGVNLRKDAKIQQTVEGIFDRWEKAHWRNNWPIQSTAAQIRKDSDVEIEELLASIKRREKSKGDDRLPTGSVQAANQQLIATWQRGIQDLNAAIAKQEGDRADWMGQVKQHFDEIPKRRPMRLWDSTNPLRDICVHYYEARSECLNYDRRIKALRAALTLCEHWLSVARELVEQQDQKREEAASTQALLAVQRRQLDTRRAGLSVENLLKEKARLEIYVGVSRDIDSDTGKATESRWVSGGIAQKPDVTDERFAQFLKAYGLKESADLTAFSPEQLNSMFIEHARTVMRPWTDISVLQILSAFEEKAPGTIEKTTKDALELATQLLPIRNDLVQGKSHILTEFSVIGGYETEALKLRTILGPHIPEKHPTVQNLWTPTADKYRVTFTNYYSVIPLYVLEGIDSVRSAYLKRVRPPAHTDKAFEFELLDILPSDSEQMLVLKLMGLGTLASVALIERVRLEGAEKAAYPDSSHFYRLNERFFSKMSEDERRLPGLPGKFYSLYEELCKPANEAKCNLILQMLLDLDAAGQLDMDKVWKDVEATCSAFKHILKEKTFNKMLTGNLYRQEIAFFHKIIREGRDSFSFKRAMEL